MRLKLPQTVLGHGRDLVGQAASSCDSENSKLGSFITTVEDNEEETNDRPLH
jgi:hypothetical protein